MTTIVDMISNNKTTSMFVKEDNVNLLWKIIINTPAFKTTIESNGVEAQQKLNHIIFNMLEHLLKKTYMIHLVLSILIKSLFHILLRSFNLLRTKM